MSSRGLWRPRGRLRSCDILAIESLFQVQGVGSDGGEHKGQSGHGSQEKLDLHIARQQASIGLVLNEYWHPIYTNRNPTERVTQPTDVILFRIR